MAASSPESSGRLAAFHPPLGRHAGWHPTCNKSHPDASLAGQRALMSPLDAELGEIPHKSGYPTHAFLAGLTDAQVAHIQSLGEEVTLPEGELILDNGQRSTCCYLVLSGSVTVALATPRLTVCVQVVGAGAMFGWSALLQGQDTIFQVRARERTVALRIEGSALWHCCQADPDLGVELLRRFLRVVSERVRATETVFAEWCGVRVSG